MKQIILIFSIVGLMIGCCSNKSLIVEDWSNMRSIPDVNITPMDNYIDVSFLTREIHSGEITNSFNDSVQAIIFYAIESGKIVDSLKIDNPKKITTPFEKGNILYNIKENYKYYFNQTPENIKIKIDILTKTKLFSKEFTPDIKIYDFIKSKQNLELTPSYSLIENGNIEFQLKAKRLKITDEYLPNSENFRVEVFTHTGKQLFSSDFQTNFLQVISEVMPKEINELHIYKYIWDGKDNNKQNVPAGKYKAKLTIPAKPNYYSTTINFEIK